MTLKTNQAQRRHKDGSVGHSGPGRPEMTQNAARDIQMVRHPGDEFKTVLNKRALTHNVKATRPKRSLAATLPLTVASLLALSAPVAAQLAEDIVRVELYTGNEIRGTGTVKECDVERTGENRTSRC